MAEVRFSRRAEADLIGIGSYTLRTWGEGQALRYLSDLEACCELLAGNPALGRPCDDIRSGLRRMECGRHVVSCIGGCYPRDKAWMTLKRGTSSPLLT
jgi:toxin ParE1/3/4